jgi:hypothetical protein
MNDEEKRVAENKIVEIAEANQIQFENICFKEHKEPIKEAIGEYKYLELVELIFDFFWIAFIGKKAERTNTMISDLRKISGN